MRRERTASLGVSRVRAGRVRPRGKFNSLRSLALLAFLGLLLFACRGGIPAIGDPGRPPPPVGFARPIGDRVTKPFALIVIRDRSSSMAVVDDGVAKELDQAVQWLSLWGRPGDRLGVVDFATRATTRIDVAELPAVLPTSYERLQLPGDDIDTNQTNAFPGAQVARHRIDSLPAGVEPRVIFVTDGLVSDAEHLTDLRATIGGDVPIYVLGVGDWPQAEGMWAAQVPTRSTWFVPEPTPMAFAGPVAELLTQLTGQEVHIQ